MTRATFIDEQSKQLTIAEQALEDAYHGSVNPMELAAMVGAFLTETDDNGRNTLWSEQGMILKGIADVAYRKLHTKRTWINRNNKEVALGVQAQYVEAKNRTNAADKLDDGTEIAGRNLDDALAHELERKQAKVKLEAIISAFGEMYETVSGRAYEPWMPEEKNPRATTSAQKASQQDREARKARLAAARG